MSIATVRAFGAISHRRPNFFASKMDVAVIKPVTLPPGRLKLATRPDLIGSLLVLMRIGIVEVAVLYQVPEIVTRRRFPGACESDSTWRTEEVRHGGSNPVARRLRCVSASRFGKEEQGWAAGSPAVGAGSDLRGGDTVRSGQNWRGWPSDHSRLGVALQRAWS